MNADVDNQVSIRTIVHRRLIAAVRHDRRSLVAADHHRKDLEVGSEDVY